MTDRRELGYSAWSVCISFVMRMYQWEAGRYSSMVSAMERIVW